MRRVISILALPFTALAVFSCAHIERTVSVPVLYNVRMNVRPVRVLVGVATRTQPLDLSASSEVEVWSPDGVNVIEQMRLDKTPVTFSRGAVVIGGRSWGVPAVILSPKGRGHIRVSATEYPGEIVLATRGESVAVINRVSIEEYTAGVVTCEMPAHWEPAALQAQAVAARTYVLWQMKQNRLNLYDVKDDVSNQVYRGLTGTTRPGRLAAERTAGAVLVYDWQFLPAFYFSTCGGHTLSASQLRGAPVIPPLSGVECDYCRASSKYHWVIRIPATEMEKDLIQPGYASGQLLDVVIANTISGGWVDTVDVVSTAGRRQIAGYVLRQAVGTSRLYSTKFKITKSGQDYIFEGWGYGHGVGLCQWGANGMALAGHPYPEILTHYYLGAGILKIY